MSALIGYGVLIFSDGRRAAANDSLLETFCIRNPNCAFLTLIRPEYDENECGATFGWVSGALAAVVYHNAAILSRRYGQRQQIGSIVIVRFRENACLGNRPLTENPSPRYMGTVAES